MTHPTRSLRLLFAANWKMHHGPEAAQSYMRSFLERHPPTGDRNVWFFPPAVSLPAVARALADRPDCLAGVQDVYWEPKGAFTGAISAPIAREAGARAALVGHSERRRVFGESDEDTARKVRAVLGSDLIPLLCVGETLEEREDGRTEAVVLRQLAAALSALEAAALATVVVAYEPVWAIGTGRNATPEDAARVHATIRGWLRQRRHPEPRILYGGSVNRQNIEALMSQRELDGVLVGGASLDPEGWAAIAQARVEPLR